MRNSIPLQYNLEWATGDSNQSKIYRLQKPGRIFAASSDTYSEVSHV